MKDLRHVHELHKEVKGVLAELERVRMWNGMHGKRKTQGGWPQCLRGPPVDAETALEKRRLVF